MPRPRTVPGMAPSASDPGQATEVRRSLVLVVCHEEPIRLTLAAIAEAAGLVAIEAPHAEQALYLAGKHPFDAAVVALALPGIGPEELCAQLRRRGRMGILVVSAGGGRRLAALEAGADDQVDMPFHAIEVEARLRALLRRTAGALAVDRAVRVGPVVVRVVRGQGAIEHSDDPLRPEEATVLGTLAERAGCLVGREALRQRLAVRHGPEGADQLDDHVMRVAHVLAAAGAPMLHTVGDAGYVLRP